MTLLNIKNTVYENDINNYKYTDKYDTNFHRALLHMNKNITHIKQIIEPEIEQYQVSKIKKIEPYHNMYDVIYNLLRYGIINDNGTEKQVCVSSASPFYPSNMVNDEATKISATLNSIIDDIIDIIHPSDYEALALDKMRLKAKAVGL